MAESSVRNSLRSILLASTLTLMSPGNAAGQDADINDPDLPEIQQTAYANPMTVQSDSLEDWVRERYGDFRVPNTILQYNTSMQDTNGNPTTVTDPQLVASNALRGAFQPIRVTPPLHYRELLGYSGISNRLNAEGEVREGGQVSVYIGVVVDLNPDGSIKAGSMDDLREVHAILEDVRRGDDVNPPAAATFGAYYTNIVPIASNPENLNRSLNMTAYNYAYARAAQQNPGAENEDVRFAGEGTEGLRAGQIAILMNNSSIPRQGFLPLEGQEKVLPVDGQVKDYLRFQPLPSTETDDIKGLLYVMFERAEHLAAREELAQQRRHTAELGLQNQSFEMGSNMGDQGGRGAGSEDVPPPISLTNN